MESLLLARPKYGIHKFNEPCLNWRFMGGRGGRTGDLLAGWFTLLFCINCILGGPLLRCTADILLLCYLQFHLSIQDFWQTQLSITIPTEFCQEIYVIQISHPLSPREAVQDLFTSLNINFCLIFELRDFSISKWGKKWLYTFYNTHCYWAAGPPYRQSIKKFLDDLLNQKTEQ